TILQVPANCSVPKLSRIGGCVVGSAMNNAHAAVPGDFHAKRMPAGFLGSRRIKAERVLRAQILNDAAIGSGDGARLAQKIELAARAPHQLSQKIRVRGNAKVKRRWRDKRNILVRGKPCGRHHARTILRGNGVDFDILRGESFYYVFERRAVWRVAAPWPDAFAVQVQPKAAVLPVREQHNCLASRAAREKFVRCKI